ncbi:TPA: histone H4 replacement-like [Bos taurus]|nr:TPA: histone H4 replacement-like [Bos taurus]
MSGRGKDGNGLGKGGTKHHRKVLRDNPGITKLTICRLAQCGGVKRISGLIYEDTRRVLKVFLENLIQDAVTYTEPNCRPNGEEAEVGKGGKGTRDGRP